MSGETSVVNKPIIILKVIVNAHAEVHNQTPHGKNRKQGDNQVSLQLLLQSTDRTTTQIYS